MAKYVIPKGWHYNTNVAQRFLFLTNNVSPYIVEFHDSAWYSEDAIPGTKDDNDLNKLHGLQYMNAHLNSASIVWKPDFQNVGVINCYAYGYHKGQRYFGPKLGSVETGDRVRTMVKCLGKDQGYYFYFEGKHIIWDRDYAFGKIRRYPHFGGDPKAPHKVIIEMDKWKDPYEPTLGLVEKVKFTKNFNKNWVL